MAKRIDKVSKLRTILNLHKFLDNPIPVMNQSLEAFKADSYRVDIGAVMRTIITKDTDLIQYVLQKNHRNYNKSILQTEHLAEFIGKGLLTSNGKYWLKQRG